MGVAGFTTFFKTYHAGKRISVSDQAKQKTLTLAIDGNALFYNLAQTELSSCGSYLNLKKDIVAFFTRLLGFNVRPIVFLDGLSPETKYEEMESRYKSKLADLKMVAINLKENRQFHYSTSFPPTPKLMAAQFKYVMVELGIEFHTTFMELDQYIVQWANDNNEKVYGILSNDSDYFFFGFNKAIYFPLSDWNMSDDGIEATGYVPSDVAKALGILEKHLPLLATINGNDFTKLKPSKHKGHPKYRIPKIISSLNRSRKLPIESILKDNFINPTAQDMKLFMKSYKFYLPAEQEVSAATGVTLANGFFFRHCTDPRFLMFKANKFFDRFFGPGYNMVNYNFLSLLVTKHAQVSTFCLEPPIHINKSIVWHTTSIRQRLFGLLAYPPDATPIKFIDLVPHLDEYLRNLESPLYTTFGIHECWDETVDLSVRIKEFCTMFGSTESKAISYASTYSDPSKPFDDVMLILFCRFLKSRELAIVVEDWMLDLWVFNYLLLGNGVALPKHAEFKKEHIRYMPTQLADLFSTLYFLAYTVVEVLNLVTVCSFKPPHQVIDTINLHLLWTVAAAQRAQANKPTTGHPLDNLFGKTEFQDLVNDDIKSKFDQIKLEIDAVSASTSSGGPSSNVKPTVPVAPVYTDESDDSDDSDDDGSDDRDDVSALSTGFKSMSFRTNTTSTTSTSRNYNREAGTRSSIWGNRW